jgi:hypothetical protein
MAPFFALKYAPPAMGKTTPKQAYPNAAPKDQKYGSIIVVSSVASTYGGKSVFRGRRSSRKAMKRCGYSMVAGFVNYSRESANDCLIKAAGARVTR